MFCKKFYDLLPKVFPILGSRIVHLTSSPEKSYSWTISSYVKKYICT